MAASQESYKSLLKTAQIYHAMDKNYHNYLDMVKSILKKEGDINQVIPESILPQSQRDLKECTILHVSANERDVEIFKLLLDNGADFTMQNQRGDTVLHYLSNCEPSESKDELISSVLSAHIKFANSSNPCNKNGISHFHIACMANHAEAVQFFLHHSVSIQQMVNMDSPRFPGYSPLHFAAEGCSIEVIDILLKNNASVSVVDARVRTALHIFLQQKLQLFDCLGEGKKDQSILEKINCMDNVGMDIVDNTGLSELHMACMMNDSSLAEHFIEETTDINHRVKVDSPVWPGYTALHFAARCNTRIFIKLLLKGAAMETKNAELITPLDMHLKKCKPTDVLSIVKCREDWSSAMFTDGKTQLVGLVTAMCESLDHFDYFENAVGNINTRLAENPAFWAGFTPLHFAVLTYDKNNNMDLIQWCLDRGADVSIQDAHGWTPIHLAYRMNKIDLTIFLLDKYQGAMDAFDKEGLSLRQIICQLLRHPSGFKVLYSMSSLRWFNDEVDMLKELGVNRLHIAVNSDDHGGLNELLGYGPNYNIDVGVSCTDPTISWSRYSGYTPLHLAIERPNARESVEILLAKGADMFAKRPDGMTPLYAVLQEDTITNDHLADLVLARLRTRGSWQTRLEQSSGIRELHLACRTFDVNAAIDLLGAKASVNARVRGDCPIWPGYTALHVLLKYAARVEDQLVYQRFQIILGMLLEHGADVTAVDGDGDTPIHLSFDHCVHDYNFVSMSVLMEHHVDFSLNPVNAKNMSHFHAACIVNNVEAVEQFLKYAAHVEDQHVYQQFQTLLGMLLEHGADVTAVNGDGDTPIHLSFDYCIHDNNFSSMSALMEHHKDFSLNPVNAKNMSHFHSACIVNNVEAVEQFLQHGVDVNQPIGLFVKNFAGETPLHLVLKRIFGTNSHLKLIDLLVAHGANVLLEDSYSYTPLHRAACDYSSSASLFENLIRFGADINAKNIFGETPLEFLLKTNEISLSGLEILLKAGCPINACNHITGEGYLSMVIDENYHKTPQAEVFKRMTASNLSTIDEMCRTALHNIVTTPKANASIVSYVEIVDYFQKLGIDLDYKDNLGKTALHLATQFGNAEAVVALINAGADINVGDTSKKTALSYALELRNTNEVHHDIIISALAIQIRKLQLLGLYVNELNGRLVEENHLRASFDSESLLCERKFLREIVVDTQPHLILNDFLSETEALATYPFVIDSKRIKVEQLLESVGEKLIEMRSVLMMQYRKTLKRAHMRVM